MTWIWRDGATTLEAGALTIGALAAADGVNIGSVKTLTTAGVAFDAAKETGGNLATIKTSTDPLVVAGGGAYVRQDTTGTIAKETGGNLATVKTNTDPFVVAGGGGYVRQDTTGTMAKETGGNLAAIKTAVERAAGTGVASASATVAVGADATVAIVAAPGLGKQIWVYGWVLIANVDGTFALKSAATVKYGTMPITKLGGSAPFSSDFEIPIFKCASNEALNITTTTCTLAGGVTYAIRDE